MTVAPQRTVRVKINLDEEQKKIVLDTMSIGQKVFQLAISLCLQEKICNYNNLHKYYYHKAKELFPNFPTGFIQSIAKQACIAIKSFNSNNPKRKWDYKGRRSSFSLPLSKLTLSYSHGSVTFSSVQKRIRTECPIPQYFLDKYQVTPEKVQSGHLLYRKGKFFLCLAYKINVPSLRTEGKTVGIDRGLYNVYATSEGQLFSSVHLKVKRRYQHNRMVLQQKGTRSAKRRLRQIADREKRFMRNVKRENGARISTVECTIGLFVNGKTFSGINVRRKVYRLDRSIQHIPAKRAIIAGKLTKLPDTKADLSVAVVTKTMQT